MIKKVLFVLIIMLPFVKSPAQTLRIGLFSNITTKATVFSAVQGSYLLSGDNRAVLTLKEKQNILLVKKGDSVTCICADKQKYTFKKVKLSHISLNAFFSLRPIDPSNELHYYDDDLEIYADLGKLQTINIVDIDNYLAGVVEAEAGNNALPEFYKAQVTLCRTYTLSHLDRHNEEGFYLCDGVHCQAYHGKCSGKNAIVDAARTTHNKVIQDNDSVLITAAFHANCGGETESAQNVWLIKRNYLAPIKDPYCQDRNNSRWERKIPIDQWIKYLISNGFTINDQISLSLLNNTQFSRKQYYKIGTDSLTYRKIRNDFQLKSAFFSVEVKNPNIEIHGRGYGHGVGMCQEGAMQMAVLGYTYEQIINFYYKNVKIIDFSNINANKNPTIKVLYTNP
ncbi:MAG TPA: SpoIID/LytB domain-containing protein [Bacteroidales bacterium]|nr:SpoIID/LytB domain-containing protein [Bacteroidales bacterium]